MEVSLTPVRTLVDRFREPANGSTYLPTTEQEEDSGNGELTSDRTALPPARVLIVEDDPVFAQLLDKVLREERDVTVVGQAFTAQEALRRAHEGRPDIVLMDIHLPDMDGIQATSLLTSELPSTIVIILTSEERPDYIQRCMLAGARAYLTKPLGRLDDLTTTIRTVRKRFLGPQIAASTNGVHSETVLPIVHNGCRLAVFSPKGGQGKTTVAVNLSVMLRQMTKRSVLLVDGDLRFGDANVLLDLPCGRSVLDLLPHIDHLDSTLLDQVLSTHSSGLKVLTRPEHPESADNITAAHLEKLLIILPRLFDLVVMDCEVSYDDKLLAILDRADHTLLVVTPNLGVIRGAKQFLRLAEALGYSRSRISTVVNRATSGVGLSQGEVEKILGPGRYFSLGSYGRLLTTSANVGRPAVLAHPRSDFADHLRGIAKHVIQVTNEQLRERA